MTDAERKAEECRLGQEEPSNQAAMAEAMSHKQVEEMEMDKSRANTTKLKCWLN